MWPSCYPKRMGYDVLNGMISVRVSRHNSQQDHIDDERVKELNERLKALEVEFADITLLAHV